MALTTNKEKLVTMAVGGRIAPPELMVGMMNNPYIPDTEGGPAVLYGMAGIVYNCRVGDSAYGWAADHIEPGVSIAHPVQVNDDAMHYLTCVGNEVVVKSGLGRGAKGVISGEHARLLADFDPVVLERLAVDDDLLIKARGRGLKIVDYPEIYLKKCSPELIEALPLRENDEGIEVPVVAEIPTYMLGSGAELNPDFVDQDMMSGDREELSQLGIDQLRLGDLVAIPDADHRFGRGYRAGAATIGLVLHGDSILTGHGAGVMTLMTSVEGDLHWANGRGRQHRQLHGNWQLSQQSEGEPVTTIDRPQTNRARLVELSVMGEVATPSFPAVPASPYLITRDGKPELIPSFGSIVL